MQGYLFSHARTSAEIGSMLETRKGRRSLPPVPLKVANG
jgi:hypothetical protein